MNATSTRKVKVEAGGEGVAAHVGLHTLGAFADRLGLAETLSARVPPAGERLPLHDRGKVLVHAMLMLAGGGEACTDIERLVPQETLFGAVCSDSTLYRTLFQVSDPAVLEGLSEAFGNIRNHVWGRMAATAAAGPVILDIDASLHPIHSENKQLAAPNFKGGYGLHNIYCFADATGECLAALLREGNAGANTIADHETVLDQAIAQLPADIAAGHRPGDDPALVRHPVQVRTDSAGCTNFVWRCHQRNIGFAVVARDNNAVHAAISRARSDPHRWHRAIRPDGTDRPGASVAEVTDLVDLSAWPPGTRLVVRREPLHPGAQRSLFPSEEFRYWAHYTDTEGDDPVDLDAHIRAHAHVEQHIRRLKDSGAARYPFTNAAANKAWLALVCMADALVRWFQQLCLTGPLAKAEPKTLRWRLWHTPARIIHHARGHTVRILTAWPDERAILSAYQRINLIC